MSSWRAASDRRIVPLSIFGMGPMAQCTPSVDSDDAAALHTVPLELVVAVAENDVIGRGNQLPWRLSADLRRFKSLTLGKTILMGRKTYESIGKALPERTNIVLTRSASFAPGDCTVVGTLQEARQAARAPARCEIGGAAGREACGDARSAADGQGVLMVIGGAQIYTQCVAFAMRIHLTLVHTRVADGDTFFSDWRHPEWHECSRESHEADEKNSSAYSFITLERRGGESAAACG
jgi:dihydrofolate reductase